MANRGNERPAHSKPFTIETFEFSGRTINEKYSKDPNYVDVRQLNTFCILYAQSYNKIVLKRIEEARPEFFDDLKMSKNELVANLSHNMCLPVSKSFSQVYRRRTAEIKEEDHLKDSIRRLVNNGDKFHPYI